VGGFTAVIPMYISESSRAENRGRMVLLEGFFAIGGIALASWIEFGLYYVQENDVSWRFPIAFSTHIRYYCHILHSVSSGIASLARP
jgi:hypothetical protein